MARAAPNRGPGRPAGTPPRRPGVPTVNDSPPPSEHAPPPRQATLSEVFGAVFWSFFGVRKRKHMQKDAVTIRPHQVILVGLVCGAMFVAALLAIVRTIVQSAGL